MKKKSNGNGTIKEYDDNDKLIFEGEYLKGKRNGKGKEYLIDDKIFEGKYLNGKKNGKWKLIHKWYIIEEEYLNGEKIS